MSDPLCGPCQDEGRLVKAAYLSHPPTCAEHYAKIAKPGTAAAGGGNSVLAHLFSLRKANKDKLRERVTSEASGERLCKPCLEGGERTKATHRMNDMDMCVTHANAARIESGPPQALKPDDVEVKAPKGPIEGQAANFMASGLDAKETVSALVNLGFGKREARAAVGEKARKEKTMAIRIDDQTQRDIIADLKSGMNFNQVSLKHSVSWGLVRKISEEAGVAAPKKAAAKPGPKPAAKVPAALASIFNGSLIEKWHREANEAFAALPLEKKGELLATLQ